MSGTITLPNNSIATSAVNGLTTTNTNVSNLQTILTGTSWDNTYNFINFSNNVHIYGLLQLGTITNVETVLTGLASTYATISSLSAYVKTSLANTFSALQTFSSGISITGGIGVPSSTMTAPAVNQIGYQIKSSSSPACNAGATTLGTITLSPVGSVWLINANTVIICGNTTVAYALFEVQTGTTWTHNNNQAPTITTIGKCSCWNTPAYINIDLSLCGTYSVTTGNQTLCFGIYVSTSASGFTPFTYITATRIA